MASPSRTGEAKGDPPAWPGAAVPEHGTDARALLREVVPRLIETSTFNCAPALLRLHHSRARADRHARRPARRARSTRTAARSSLSPVATEIEEQTVRWIAELIGFPADGGGILVSGGNMANIVCFLAARARRLPGDVGGTGSGPPATLCRATPRPRPTPGSTRPPTSPGSAPTRCAGSARSTSTAWMATVTLGADRSKTDIAAETQPFIVVGTAGIGQHRRGRSARRDRGHLPRARGSGSTSTARTARFAAVAPRRARRPEGTALADSVAVDPHKWLYAPLEAGCALVRDPDALRHTFEYHPSYYQLRRHGGRADDQLPRVRPAELARFPRAESLARDPPERARGLPETDWRRHRTRRADA